MQTFRLAFTILCILLGKMSFFTLVLQATWRPQKPGGNIFLPQDRHCALSTLSHSCILEPLDKPRKKYPVLLPASWNTLCMLLCCPCWCAGSGLGVMGLSILTEKQRVRGSVEVKRPGSTQNWPGPGVYQCRNPYYLSGIRTGPECVIIVRLAAAT